MTQQTQKYSDFKWRVEPTGLEIYDEEGFLFKIPEYEFPVLILNLVEVLKKNTKSID